MTNVTITPTDNGPSLVEGLVRILDADGTAYDLSEQTAIFSAATAAQEPSRSAMEPT